MGRYAVHRVDRITMGELPCWQVEFRVSDPGPGEQPTHFYLFPQFAVAQRIAEYDLGPEDVDTAVDILLGEQFLPGQEGQPGLHDADTIEEARRAHISRCARAKLAARISSRGIQNPLEMIRSSYRVDHRDLAKRRRAVQEMRQEIRVQKERGRRG